MKNKYLDNLLEFKLGYMTLGLFFVLFISDSVSMNEYYAPNIGSEWFFQFILGLFLISFFSFLIQRIELYKISENAGKKQIKVFNFIKYIFLFLIVIIFLGKIELITPTINKISNWIF